MFPRRYFAPSFFAPRYFAEVGAIPTSGTPGRGAIRVTGTTKAAKREVTQ